MFCQITLRTIIEAAAELDPDQYVPILDAIDEGVEDLECDETEPEELEQWLSSHPVPVYERCHCCGHSMHHGEWII